MKDTKSVVVPSQYEIVKVEEDSMRKTLIVTLVNRRTQKYRKENYTLEQ